MAFARTHGATEAWIESPAFSRAEAQHSLGALFGVVALELSRAGIALHTAPMASARKLLLGKLPREGVKVAIFDAWRAAGARFDSLDVADAMAAANWGLSEHGVWCFCQGEAA